MTETLLVIVAALLLDAAFGETKRGHPLVLFGRFAAALEQRWNDGGARVLRGLLALLIALSAPLILLFAVTALTGASAVLLLILDALVLYFAIGRRSLREHALAVRDPLLRGKLEAARQATSRIVSRDTAEASERELVTAVVETSLENTNDAVFASLFWYVLGGSVGVLLHRCSNTLDAMWGYRNERFEAFGRCAARLDDLLGFLPAQCLSALFCLCASGGQRMAALQAWLEQGWRWKSINAGSVMASGAAALGLSLGGSATYHGQPNERPVLGGGRTPQLGDIEACFTLQNRVICLFLLVLLGLVWC